MRRRDNRIGIFSTVPLEPILAAGLVPVDVNNQFVHTLDPREILFQSDAAGLPRSLCAWTRGLFTATLSSGLRRVVVVPEGDCTNNVTMARLLERRGIDVVEFRYPVGARDRGQALVEELERFCRRLGTSLSEARQAFEQLRPVRSLLAEVDRACWQERRIPGSEARLFLLESTDMRGNPSLFARRLERALADSASRPPQPGPAVAIFGVPTALADLQSRIEAAGGFVALCETEHDFAMLPPSQEMEAQFLAYAYPYGIGTRLARFKRLLEERSISGVVIYSQSFCHHNLEQSRVERELASWPCLVIEADVPSRLPARDSIRLESFVSLLSRRRPASASQSQPTSISEPASASQSTSISESESASQPTPKLDSAPALQPESTSGMESGAESGRGAESTPPRIALDLGSRFAKIVVRSAAGESRFSQDTVEFYRRHARRRGGRLYVDVSELAAGTDGAGEQTVRVSATGYGRHLVELENALVFPEIDAHAAGARSQVDVERFVLLDLGGQDTKAIKVGPEGVESFVMNDKCAAGSGRYVENMARLLGLPVEEIVGRHQDPVALTNVCATFGESEVIGCIVDSVPVERIAAGIMASVAERSAQLLRRLEGIEGLPLYLSGGLAEAGALRCLLAELLPVSNVAALPEPRFNGALGCLVLAAGKEADGSRFGLPPKGA